MRERERERKRDHKKQNEAIMQNAGSNVAAFYYKIQFHFSLLISIKTTMNKKSKSKQRIYLILFELGAIVSNISNVVIKVAEYAEES